MRSWSVIEPSVPTLFMRFFGGAKPLSAMRMPRERNLTREFDASGPAASTVCQLWNRLPRMPKPVSPAKPLRPVIAKYVHHVTHINSTWLKDFLGATADGVT